MTMTKKYIEDKDGNQVLPITHLSAVKDSNGNTLEDILWEEKEYDPTHYSGMGKVVLQKNMVSDVNTLTQAMLAQTNTIYVIKYDFVLGSDITVPANCVLKFDGGSFSTAYNITLGHDVKIIGNKSVIELAGTIYMNVNCTIQGIVFKRTSAMSDGESIMLFDDDRFARISSEINTIVRDCDFEYSVGDANNIHGNVVELVSKGNFLYSMFYGVTFENIHITSWADNAFYVHSETTSSGGTTANGCITDVLFLRCIVNQAKCGWKIESNSSYAVEKVSLINCSAQGHTWSSYAVNCGKANRITIVSSEFWDWHDTSVAAPINFTSETGEVFIDYVTDSKGYVIDGVNKKLDNKIHIDHLYNSNYLLSDFMDFTKADIPLIDLYNVPNGFYNLPQDATIGDKLGLITNQGGTLMVGGNAEFKEFIFISNSRDTIASRKQIAFMGITIKPSASYSLTQNSSSLWTKAVIGNITSYNNVDFNGKYIETRTFDSPSGTSLPNANDNPCKIFFKSDVVLPAISTNGSWRYLMLRPDYLKDDSNHRPSYGNTVRDRGLYFFDETLNKPIWWTGTSWVDATGATV